MAGLRCAAKSGTIASMLKEIGYATDGFGKWACGGRNSTGVPEEHGSDAFLGYYDQVHAHSYYPPYLIRNSDGLPLAGNRGDCVAASRRSVGDGGCECRSRVRARPGFEPSPSPAGLRLLSRTLSVWRAPMARYLDRHPELEQGIWRCGIWRAYFKGWGCGGSIRMTGRSGGQAGVQGQSVARST